MASDDTTMYCLIGALAFFAVYMLITWMCKSGENFSPHPVFLHSSDFGPYSHGPIIENHQMNLQLAASIGDGLDIDRHPPFGILASPAVQEMNNLPPVPHPKIKDVVNDFTLDYFNKFRNEPDRIGKSLAYHEAANKNISASSDIAQYMA